ncbi:uncharacterized protein TNCV_1248311 [Trichonephila clavipes]|nr:uncharacterized protein TNCV_1248311 [Trichonephila clavipes]
MRVWKQLTDEHQTTRKTGSGRWKVTSARDDRHLLCRMVVNDRTPSSWLLAARWSTATDESRFNLWDHDGRICARRYAGEPCLLEFVIERHSDLTPEIMDFSKLPSLFKKVISSKKKGTFKYIQLQGLIDETELSNISQEVPLWTEDKVVKWVKECNINGLTSPATRIKLDQLLEIALKQDVKVIAVQETKLKESTSLKVKGFNIFRVDRKSKSGGGLAFFVRDINYQKIEYPTDWSDLEVQGIRIQWRGKPLDIINVYHPPNHKPLPPALSNLLNKNSIIVGDLNAKHPSWGCSCSNARG